MNNTARLNGFDALRSVAMWLGILLHSLIAYKLVPEFGWPTDPSSQSGFYNWLYNFIHSFRMPLFFMVSGFFTRLVIEKKGIFFFIRQRGQRIVLPFIIGIILIVPVTMIPFHYYNFRVDDGLSSELALNKSISGVFKWSGLAHLWFLYYLIIYYSGTYLVLKGFNIIKEKFNNHVSRFRMHFGVILLLTVLLISLLTSYNNHLIPPVYTGLRIRIFNLSYYAVFYVLGWILNHQINVLKDLSRYGAIIATLGLALSVFNKSFQILETPLLLSHVFSAMQTVLLVFGITGLFLRLFNRETTFWRYCSDASYWMYLIHLVLIAWLQVVLLKSALSPALRLPVVLISTLVITLVTYHFFVRNTIIGTILNGKRKV